MPQPLTYDPELLGDHFDRHKDEFNATDERHYEQMAANFLQKVLSGDQVECRACAACTCFVTGLVHECEVHGDVIRFDPTTDEFAVLGVNGLIRTYFKPNPVLTNGRSNIHYFHWCCDPTKRRRT